MIPENLQDRNVRRFKGFTPKQVQQLLESKGLSPNTREAAEYLGAMAEKAENILQNKSSFQYGGSVGGFDDKSTKLFDAAVKRKASSDPKPPELQRYLDNVIETRGMPTMVYPTTADPLQGYQAGGMPTSALGALGRQLQEDPTASGLKSPKAIPRKVQDRQMEFGYDPDQETRVAIPVKAQDRQMEFGYDPDQKKSFSIRKDMLDRRENFMPLEPVMRRTTLPEVPPQGMPTQDFKRIQGQFGRPGPDFGTPRPDFGDGSTRPTLTPEQEAILRRKITSTMQRQPQPGPQDILAQPPTLRQTLLEERLERLKNAPLKSSLRAGLQRNREIEALQNEINRQKELDQRLPEYLALTGEEFAGQNLTNQVSPFLDNPKGIAAYMDEQQRLGTTDGGIFGTMRGPLGQYNAQAFDAFRAGMEQKYNMPFEDILTLDRYGYDLQAVSSPTDMPSTRNPLETGGAASEQKANLDQAQANLALIQEQANQLQQQLASLPVNAEEGADQEALDKQRQGIVDQINRLTPQITAAESALASASQQFQTTSVPTASEAVGATVSTPGDVITQQPVDLITGQSDQFIDPTTGQLSDAPQPPTTAVGETSTVDMPQAKDAVQADVTKTAVDVQNTNFEERTGELSTGAIADAQQIETDKLAINEMEAEQGTATTVKADAKRTLQQGELISGAANAEKASQFVEGIEAATGEPSSAATVQGQLTDLMKQFEGDTPPPWAAGAMRQATAIMAKRGLAASSMAGQAIVQAAMESALPIAMQDAETVKEFEFQNLSNRQERAILAAQQRANFLNLEYTQEFQARVTNAARISDIANINFSAEQQINLENSNLAQTMELANLTNRQALLMATASAVTQADFANLDNRQTAQNQNANNFLQMDLANLGITQQNDFFKNQSVIQGLFTDASAENAASQFNATSQNQVNQFYDSLSATVGQFNSSQMNAMEQYNVGQLNAMDQFRAELISQREVFNATQALQIAQANAVWRQNLTTLNNAALNDANRQDALQANNLTQKGLDEIWQKERDLMAYAFATAESAAERRNQLLLNDLKAEAAGDSAFSSALGSFGSAIISGFFEPGNLKFLFGG